MLRVFGTFSKAGPCEYFLRQKLSHDKQGSERLSWIGDNMWTINKPATIFVKKTQETTGVTM